MNGLLISACLAAAASLCSSVHCQVARQIKTVLPAANASVEGDSAVPYMFFSTSPLLSVYKASELGIDKTVRIRGLRYRRDGNSSLSAGGVNVKFDLSTSAVEPDTLANSFTSNHGDDRRRVFDGTISWPSVAASGSPSPFAIEVEFTTEFEWDPRRGNLIIHIRPDGFSLAGALDAATSGVGSVYGIANTVHDFAPVVELILDTTTAPSGFVDNEGPSSESNGWGSANSSWRALEIYEASAIALDGRSRIQAISWRPDAGTTFAGGTYDCEIYMSTTTVDTSSVDPVFDNNHGADRRLVYAGSLTMPEVTATATPQAYDLTCFLQNPFEYNASLGNLAVEIAVSSSTHTADEPIDTLPVAGNAVAGLWAASNTASTGTLTSNVSVMAFSTEPMPTIPESHDAQFFAGQIRQPFHRDASRAMFLYPPSELATTRKIWIDRLSFRPFDSANDFGPVTWECTVDLSQAAITAGPLDSTFDNNHGTRRERVFDGKVSVPLVPGGGPADDFPISIQLDHAYYYNPLSGPLIVDIRVTSRNGNTRFMDAAINSNIWRVTHNSDPDATVADSNSELGLVIRLGGVGANALAESYGMGCPGSSGTPECFVRSLPNLPNEDFAVDLRGGPSAWFNLLLIGASETNLPLTLAGAPGCTLLNGREYGTFVAITDSVGDASYPIPLPNDPAFYDQGLFVQWACLDATVNNLGVTFSNGVRLLLKR